MRTSTALFILASVATLAGQILDPLRENAGRPPTPPLINFLGLAGVGRMATDPSLPPQGPVARVVWEEFQLRTRGQPHPPTLSQTVTTEFDDQGREMTKVEKNTFGETKSVTAYQNGRIVTEISTFTRDEKPIHPEEWNYWTYDAAGRITDFRRGRGDTIENHYTNLKYDQQGRLTSFEYHQGLNGALFTRTEYKYADERKTIEEIEYDEHGDRFEWRSETLDGQGRVVKFELSRKDSEVQVALRYDSKGRMIEQLTKPYDVGSSGIELSIPPGKVTIAYDDETHTREISYAEEKETLRSITRLDETGAIVGLEIEPSGGEGGHVALECTSDSHGNWTECRQWLTSEGNRTANKLWRRTITYR
jgi:YD repeat-containing protein